MLLARMRFALSIYEHLRSTEYNQAPSRTRKAKIMTSGEEASEGASVYLVRLTATLDCTSSAISPDGRRGGDVEERRGKSHAGKLIADNTEERADGRVLRSNYKVRSSHSPNSGRRSKYCNVAVEGAMHSVNPSFSLSVHSHPDPGRSEQEITAVSQRDAFCSFPKKVHSHEYQKVP